MWNLAKLIAMREYFPTTPQGRTEVRSGIARFSKISWFFLIAAGALSFGYCYLVWQTPGFGPPLWMLAPFPAFLVSIFSVRASTLLLWVYLFVTYGLCISERLKPLAWTDIAGCAEPSFTQWWVVGAAVLMLGVMFIEGPLDWDNAKSEQAYIKLRNRR